MQLDFLNEGPKRLDEAEKEFRRLMERTFSLLNVREDTRVEVTLVDDELIRRLNRDYRHVDEATDVLSFVYGFDGPKTGERPANGEIIISYDTAMRRARRMHRPIMGELATLFVHGLLHILGYDHMEPDDRRRMLGLQRRILEGETEK